jgi:hypothetical protein
MDPYLTGDCPSLQIIRKGNPMNQQHDRTARTFAREIIAYLEHAGIDPCPAALQDICRRWVHHNFMTRDPRSERAMIRATVLHVTSMQQQTTAA